MSGKTNGVDPSGRRSVHHRNDLRDHIAGALQNDGVTNTDILARDFVFIVQRRPSDQDAAHIDRFQFGDRGEGARASDLDADFAQHRRCLFSRKLPGGCPPGRAPDEAKPALQAEVVDLVDDTIDIVAKSGTGEADLVLKRFRIRSRSAAAATVD